MAGDSVTRYSTPARHRRGPRQAARARVAHQAAKTSMPPTSARSAVPQTMANRTVTTDMTPQTPAASRTVVDAETTFGLPDQRIVSPNSESRQGAMARVAAPQRYEAET